MHLETTLTSAGCCRDIRQAIVEKALYELGITVPEDASRRAKASVCCHALRLRTGWPPAAVAEPSFFKQWRFEGGRGRYVLGGPWVCVRQILILICLIEGGF